MNFKPGEVIPYGFIVEIESWENDGDHYDTIVHTGLTPNDVEFFKLVEPLFNSKNSNKNPGYGNSDFDESMVVDLWELMNENPWSEKEFEKYTGITKSTVDPDSYEVTCVDNIRSKIMNNITCHSVDYDYDFIRVVEAVSIWYNREEVKIPEFGYINRIVNK